MRIIFVGMYNKPGKMPLCGSTKTGKLLKRITDKLPWDVGIMKTNLYDVEYYPSSSGEKRAFALEWHERINPLKNDIIILLGAEVHRNFVNRENIIIKLAHPSSMWSYEDMNEYIAKAINLINQTK